MQATAAIDALRWKADGSWSDLGACQALLRRLERSGISMTFTHVGRLAGKPERLEALEQVAERLRKEDVQLTAADPSERWISFTGGADQKVMTARLDGENWGACSTWLINFVEGLRAEFHDELLIGPTIYVKPDITTPRLRPPRRHKFLEMESCCDVLSAEALRQAPIVIRHPKYREEFDKVFRALATDTLPDGAQRTKNDDLLTLQWAPEDAREEQVRKAVAARQRWLRDRISLDLETGYNESGDARVRVLGLIEHPDATFYGEATGQAYKAVVAFKRQLDAKALDEIRIWLHKGALPDGKPLKALSLILPNRQAALDVRDVALAAGVSKVLYVDDSGGWWDPFPEGDWIE